MQDVRLPRALLGWPVSSLGPLEPYRIEPYRRDAVLAFIATLDKPFTFVELCQGCGLPRNIVIRVVDRLVKKGFLTRHQVPMTNASLWSGGQHNRTRGGTRLTWLYRVASWDA